MSGLYGLFVLGLFFWVRRNFFSNKILRFWSLAVLLLMTSEAILGAKLVIFGLVGTNDTFSRILIMAFHQLNSFLLMGATLRLALAASPSPESLADFSPSSFSQIKKGVLGFFLLVAMTGAWASLSNTLYPSEGIFEGLLKDFSQESHPLVRLRILHPLFASLLCSFVMIYAWVKYLSYPRWRTLFVLLVFLFAFGLGWATLFSLAPLPMKIAHLLMAHGLWLFFINEVFDSSPRVE
jgi:cytochrome c oxidase assembly protein subunit 15